MTSPFAPQLLTANLPNAIQIVTDQLREYNIDLAPHKSLIYSAPQSVHLIPNSIPSNIPISTHGFKQLGSPIVQARELNQSRSIWRHPLACQLSWLPFSEIEALISENLQSPEHASIILTFIVVWRCSYCPPFTDCFRSRSLFSILSFVKTFDEMIIDSL